MPVRVSEARAQVCLDQEEVPRISLVELRAFQFRLQAAAISYALLCHHEVRYPGGNSKDASKKGSSGLLVTFAYTLIIQ